VTLTAGMFAGSLNNTPALAGVLETIKSYVPAAGGASLDQMLAEPVVGYSITYPVGVVGMILTGENDIKPPGIGSLLQFGIKL
jgi:putative transport protein